MMTEMVVTNRQLHKVRVAILKLLRRTGPTRFSALMKPTGLESDTFKFHLRHLAKLGYIEKTLAGEYQLTALGKEFANTIDDTSLAEQKQPKLSVMLIVPRNAKDGQKEFLLQKRLRSPYYGYWSFITGPILWGESFEEAAARELKKQTGLSAEFEVKIFCRKRDYLAQASNLLEDKLFVVLEAFNVQDGPASEWSGGENHWMTLEALQLEPKTFKSDLEILDAINRDSIYVTLSEDYDVEQY